MGLCESNFEKIKNGSEKYIAKSRTFGENYFHDSKHIKIPDKKTFVIPEDYGRYSFD